MNKSQQIKSDLVKYKCAIRLNNFSISDDIERAYNFHGTPPFMFIERLKGLLADAILIEHQDKVYYEVAKNL